MADVNSLPRMKPCVVPTMPGDFNPATTYNVNDLVKIGEYTFLAVDSTKVIWLCSAYGVGATVSAGILSSFGSDFMRVYHTGGAADIRLATTTRALDTAELIALSNAMPSLNLTVVGNPAWLAIPPILSSGQGNSTFSAGNKVFRCKRKVVGSGNTSIFPVETELYAPQDMGYWEELVGYVPEVEGAIRTWCKAENPIERITCGRCGNPI